MQFWLVKSEPFKYSWQQLLIDGSTCWDGVRNYQARNNLQAMRECDKAFFYHSNEGLAIVGIVEICRSSYPDPTADNPRWLAVDVRPICTLKKAVCLHEIKANPKLSNMAMLKQGRLSVCPISLSEWQEILNMGETKIDMD